MDELTTITQKALTIVDIVALIIGVALNGSIILIIVTRKVNSSPRNYLLANVAIGDVFLLLTCDLVGILIMFGVVDFYDTVICLWTGAAVVVSQGVSVLTLTALSMDRFLAIVHPFAILRLQPGKIYGTAVIVIWLISLIVAAPIFFIGGAGTSENDSYCEYVPISDMSGIVYDITRAALFYLIPLLIICVSYIVMAHRIFRSAAFARNSSNSCERVQKERQKLGFLVIAIVFLFAVCWAPTTFFSIYKHYQFKNIDLLLLMMYEIQLQAWCPTMVYINGCTNPIILYLMSRSYREGLVKLFCLKTRKSSKQMSMNTSTRMLSTFRNQTKLFRIIKDEQEMTPLGEKE